MSKHGDGIALGGRTWDGPPDGAPVGLDITDVRELQDRNGDGLQLGVRSAQAAVYGELGRL